MDSLSGLNTVVLLAITYFKHYILFSSHHRFKIYMRSTIIRLCSDLQDSPQIWLSYKCPVDTVDGRHRRGFKFHRVVRVDSLIRPQGPIFSVPSTFLMLCILSFLLWSISSMFQTRLPSELAFFSPVCVQGFQSCLSMEIFNGMAMCSLKNWLKRRRTSKFMWLTYSGLNVFILIQGHLPLDKDHDNTLLFSWNEFTSLRPPLLIVIWQNCTADALDVSEYACLLEKKRNGVYY